MKSFVVFCLVLSIAVGTGRSQLSGSSSSVGGIDCYLFCTVACFAGPLECAMCMGKCLIFGSALRDTNSFCKLGCATSRCTKFLNDGDSDQTKMKGCVNSCSQTCT